MELEQLKIETENFTERVTGINKWIKSNPQITDPNAYEIMDCNVSLAEYIAEYRNHLNELEVIETVQNETYPVIENIPELVSSIKELNEMDQLRDTAHHPFFQSEEANSLYNAVKQSQISMNYDIPEDIETRRIKKELLCKSMSVPFYIWQTQRKDPEYQYDNATEFSGMKAMLDIYKSEGNTQFVPEIEALFGVIEKNYKYSDTKITEKHA